MSIGGIGGNAQSVEGTNGIQHVAFFVEKNEVGMNTAISSRLGLMTPPTFVFFWASGG